MTGHLDRDARFTEKVDAAEDVVQLAKALFWYAEQRSRSQREVARRTRGTPGLSQTMVNEILAGRTALSARNLLRPLADACGITSDDHFKAINGAWDRIQRVGEQRPQPDHVVVPHPRTPSGEVTGGLDTARDQHLETLARMAEVADRLHGDYLPLAQELYERVLGMRREILGAQHPRTLTAKHNLGVVLAQLGDFDAASRVLEEAYRSRATVLGPAEPATLASMEALATACWKVGERQKARKLLEQCVAHRQDNLDGSDETRTRYLDTVDNLLDMLRQIGDRKAAADLRARRDG